MVLQHFSQTEEEKGFSLFQHLDPIVYSLNDKIYINSCRQAVLQYITLVTIIGATLTSNADSELKRKKGMERSKDAPAQEKYGEEDTTNNQSDITSDVHVEIIQQPFQKIIISSKSDSTNRTNANKPTNRRYEVDPFFFFFG